MGYCAQGNGNATLIEGADINELKVKLSELETGISYEFKDNQVEFEEWDDHWHEADTYNFLNTLIPYIESGVANYGSYEDEEPWRYVFNKKDKTWEEEVATVSYNFEGYSDREIIDELKKRGYIVIKGSSNEINTEELKKDRDHWKQLYEDLNEYVEKTYKDY